MQKTMGCRRRTPELLPATKIAGGAVVRIREGGEVLDRVEHDEADLVVRLGVRPMTLFLVAAESAAPISQLM